MILCHIVIVFAVTVHYAKKQYCILGSIILTWAVVCVAGADLNPISRAVQ